MHLRLFDAVYLCFVMCFYMLLSACQPSPSQSLQTNLALPADKGRLQILQRPARQRPMQMEDPVANFRTQAVLDVVNVGASVVGSDTSAEHGAFRVYHNGTNSDSCVGNF